jgi:hypothetical protein
MPTLNRKKKSANFGRADRRTAFGLGFVLAPSGACWVVSARAPFHTTTALGTISLIFGFCCCPRNRPRRPFSLPRNPFGAFKATEP